MFPPSLPARPPEALLPTHPTYILLIPTMSADNNPNSPAAPAFADVLKLINYPHHEHIATDNFRQPNFEHVASALLWMIQQYDPSIPVHDNVDTEDDRVEFLVGIVRAMHSRAGIQLDAKNLYAADERAVGELSKVASLLYRAIKMSEEEEEDVASNNDQPNDFAVDLLADVEKAKALAIDIAASGARLTQLLQQQDGYKGTRSQALRHDGKAQQHVETTLKQTLESTQTNVNDMEERVRDWTKDGKDLSVKIAKRKQDLDRSEEHLTELKHIRPSYMDEYEILEEELKELHQTYVTRVRNIHYLERDLIKLEKREAEVAQRAQEARLKLQRQLQAEEEALLLMNDDDSTTSEDDSLSTASSRSTSAPTSRSSGGGGDGGSGRPGVARRTGTSSDPPRANANAAVESPSGTASTSISSEGAPLSDGSSVGNADSDTDDSAW